MVEDGAPVDRLEQPRDQRYLNAERLAVPDGVDQDVVGLGGEGEDHSTGACLRDRGDQCPRTTKDWEWDVRAGIDVGGHSARHRVSVQEADCTQPVTLILGDPFDDQPAHRAGADDQGRNGEGAVADRLGADGDQYDACETGIHHGEQPQAQGQSDRVVRA